MFFNYNYNNFLKSNIVNGINSGFNANVIDRNQDYFEGISSLDLANPALPVLEDVGKSFNTIQVRNPSVCKHLLVTFLVKQKGAAAATPEQMVLCPGEFASISFKRDAITQVSSIELLDESALTAGTWTTSGSYTALGSPTADDFADDGGSISPVLVRLGSC